MRNNPGGYTLIELMVVVAIIGILSSIVSVSMGRAIARARFAKAQGDMDAIRVAATQYYVDNDETWADDSNPGEAPAFVPQYLARWPDAPCGGRWNYDWDNYNFMPYNPGVDQPNVRVTLRDNYGINSSGVPYGSSADSFLVLCIDNMGFSDCGVGLYGGQDILATPDHFITCN